MHVDGRVSRFSEGGADARGRQRAIVRAGSRRGRGDADREDVCSDVLVELLTHLDDPCRSLPADAAAFGKYVAVAAHHGCDRHLRRKYPLRWRARNRIRYLLEHDRRLSIWQSADGVWWCGRAGWQSMAPGVTPARDRLTIADPRRVRDLMVQIFELGRGPLWLTDVVDLAAAIWGLPAAARDESTALEEIADSEPAAHLRIEQRQRVEAAWTHIQALPIRQRHALLLNLKNDSIGLLISTGTASLRTIARALEIDAGELARVWNSLPLSDNDIAARLGCTRQQVINLRMAARKRLANRLAGWSQYPGTAGPFHR